MHDVNAMQVPVVAGVWRTSQNTLRIRVLRQLVEQMLWQMRSAPDG